MTPLVGVNLLFYLRPKNDETRISIRLKRILVPLVLVYGLSDRQELRDTRIKEFEDDSKGH